MRKTLNAIVRGERLVNRGPRGGRSYAGVRGLMNYLAFGRYGEQSGPAPAPRGIWLDHNQEEQSHADVLAWAKEKVHRYRYEYAYQLLLSTRRDAPANSPEPALDAVHYNRVLQEGSTLSGVHEWVYTVHGDTAHPHAHAILFRKEKLSAAEYRQWQAAMQEGLERALAGEARVLEAQRVRERSRTRAPAGEPRRAREATLESRDLEPGEAPGDGDGQAGQRGARGQGWGVAL